MKDFPPLPVVITGLVPVIHAFSADAESRGWPGLGQAMTIYETVNVQISI
jgi:hypothetical protein